MSKEIEDSAPPSSRTFRASFLSGTSLGTAVGTLPIAGISLASGSTALSRSFATVRVEAVTTMSCLPSFLPLSSKEVSREKTSLTALTKLFATSGFTVGWADGLAPVAPGTASPTVLVNSSSVLGSIEIHLPESAPLSDAGRNSDMESSSEASWPNSSAAALTSAWR